MLNMLGLLVGLVAMSAAQRPATLHDYQVLQRDDHNQGQTMIALPAPLHKGQLAQVQVFDEQSLTEISSAQTQASSQEKADGVQLSELPMGGPYRIEVSVTDAAGQTVQSQTYQHILVGDLWILAGQSNMEGVPPVEEPLEPLPAINMLNLDNTWKAALPPLHRKYEANAPAFTKLTLGYNTQEQYDMYRKKSLTESPVGGTCSGFFFARKLVEESGVPIGLIPCAYGGTNLAAWDPAGLEQGDQSLYGFMIQRVQLAGGHVRGMLWYQGESDSTPGCLVEPNYKVRLRAFFEAVRRDVNDPNLPILQAQIAHFIGYEWKYGKKGEYDQPYEIVREFQRTLADEMENLHTVPTVDLSHWDLIHLSYKAQKRLGLRFAYLALPYVKPDVTPRQEIKLASVRFGNEQRNKIIVEYTGVNGQLCSQGAPYGFEIFDPTSGEYRDWVFRIDFDPRHPNRLILNFDIGGLTLPLDTQVYYAPHCFKYANITDSNDMSIPAMGPIPVKPFVAP